MNRSSQSTVVFAYSEVGVRCLSTLLANDIEIKLVVTHERNSEENVWFDYVERLATLNNIAVIKPDNPNTAQVISQVSALSPDWLFSFFYRLMLNEDLLNIPKKGALNMHGSLLPLYRGRAPINWAVLYGERQTGASLHRMVVKPDAGNLVDQQSIPILPNDTAHQVCLKVATAAEIILMRTIPELLAGTATEQVLDLSKGSYFGGRTPQDGRIDWSCSAQSIHNLIRAVAPPYPGAFFDITELRIEITGSYFKGEDALSEKTRLYWHGDEFWADCSDGKRIRILKMKIEGSKVSRERFNDMFGEELILC